MPFNGSVVVMLLFSNTNHADATAVAAGTAIQAFPLPPLKALPSSSSSSHRQTHEACGKPLSQPPSLLLPNNNRCLGSTAQHSQP